MQVNKNGEIQNRAELEFRQHSAHSTTELKTQRSLCYAAGQDPGGQHQPPLILQDFSPEYASIFPKSKKMAKKYPMHAQDTRKVPEEQLSQWIPGGRQRNILD